MQGKVFGTKKNLAARFKVVHPGKGDIVDKDGDLEEKVRKIFYERFLSIIYIFTFYYDGHEKHQTSARTKASIQ